MEVTGKIIAVLPLRTGESARGPWKSQEYVIEFYESNSQYSSKMVFNVFGDNVDRFAIQEGGEYTVSANIDAREWNGRWFNDIRAWRVMPATAQPQAAPAATPAASAPAPTATMPAGIKTPEPFSAESQSADSSSDLPF